MGEIENGCACMFLFNDGLYAAMNRASSFFRFFHRCVSVVTRHVKELGIGLNVLQVQILLVLSWCS